MSECWCPLQTLMLKSYPPNVMVVLGSGPDVVMRVEGLLNEIRAYIKKVSRKFPCSFSLGENTARKYPL